MKRNDELTSASEVLKHYITEVREVSCFGIVSLAKVLSETGTPIRAIESAENAKRGFMKIKSDGELILQNRRGELNNVRYHIRDFLMKVCGVLNSYLSGIFDVDIEYRLIEEDNVNLIFDGELIEKSIQDGVFGLLCEAGVKNRKVTVYAKDLSRHVKICMRCEFAKEKKISERAELFSEYSEKGMGSYAELIMNRIGGQYKYICGQKDSKIELYIPKNLKINQYCLSEEETEIVLGEKVVQYTPCDRSFAEMIFGAFIRAERKEV